MSSEKQPNPSEPAQPIKTATSDPDPKESPFEPLKTVPLAKSLSPEGKERLRVKRRQSE